MISCLLRPRHWPSPSTSPLTPRRQSGCTLYMRTHSTRCVYDMLMSLAWHHTVTASALLHYLMVRIHRSSRLLNVYERLYTTSLKFTVRGYSINESRCRYIVIPNLDSVKKHSVNKSESGFGFCESCLNPVSLVM